VLAASCAVSPPTRENRDARLLRRDDRPAVEPPAPRTVPEVPTIELPPQSGELGLSLEEAIASSLRSSKVVRVTIGGYTDTAPVTGYDVEAAKTRITAALAAFDTSIGANLAATRYRLPPNSIYGPGLSQPLLRDELVYGGGFTKPLVTGGQATLFYDPNPAYMYFPQGNGGAFNPLNVATTTLALRQPLLRGAGVDVNTAPIQVAQLRYEQSAWEFKREVMQSVRNTVEAYWELHASRTTLRAVEEVLPLLEEMVDLQEKALQAERTIFADVAKARALLHQYRQQHAAVESRVLASELRLRNLMGQPPYDGVRLIPISPPSTLVPEVDTSVALAEAFDYQPEIVRQRLNIAIREKELIVAQNGTLPQLDFLALYRMNGVGDNVAGALNQLSTASFSDWQVGATLSTPIGQRKARADLRAAELTLTREKVMLDQSRFHIAHQLSDVMRQISLDYKQYHEASLRLQSADQWLEGARVRYQNPLPAGEGNWLLQYLNDYLLALRFRTDSAAETAGLLAAYNTDLIRLEEVKGTLLRTLDINLAYDPCSQIRELADPPAGLRVEPARPIGPEELPAPQPATPAPQPPAAVPPPQPAGPRRYPLFEQR
jgi:outer membrane protein TolC